MHILPAVNLAQEQCAVTSPDPALEPLARAHLDNLTKPRGSLGRLEDMAVRLFQIQDGRTPLRARPARMYTIAGDHGVCAEGVAACPQDVTTQMVQNFMNGGAGINVLCTGADIDLVVVDVGMIADLPDHPRLVRAKVRPGTRNLAHEAAMTRAECVRALEVGIALAELAYQQGYVCVGTGEMGIGNTTPSSALLCAFLGLDPKDMTGMGAGVPPAGLAHKTRVIRQGLLTHARVVEAGDPIAVLAALGGYEIAALAGLVLGAAARRMAVMIDGFIATAAYAAARSIQPQVRGYCFFSHGSAEAGHGRALSALDERPLLDLGLRLGEGTGAALGLQLLTAAADIFNDMATFEKAGVVL